MWCQNTSSMIDPLSHLTVGRTDTWHGHSYYRASTEFARIKIVQILTVYVYFSQLVMHFKHFWALSNDVLHLLIITSPAGAVAKHCDKRVCVSICVCVCGCLSVREVISGTTRTICAIFPACCLWPWLGPFPAGWRNPNGNWATLWVFFPVTMHCTASVAKWGWACTLRAKSEIYDCLVWKCHCLVQLAYCKENMHQRPRGFKRYR